MFICILFMLTCACPSSDRDNTSNSNGESTDTSDENSNTDTSSAHDGYVEPDIILDGAGKNIDSPAFWTAPNPEKSLLLITGKENNLVEIWQYPFEENELNPLQTSTEVNGIAVDQANDLLYLSLSGSREVEVYSLPGLTPIATFGQGIIGQGENNLALFQPAEGLTSIYVTDNNNVYYFDEEYELLGQFMYLDVLSIETVAVDNFHEIIYVPEELGAFGSEGVHAYYPDGRPFYKNGTNRFGAGHFGGDEEGITIYCRLDENGSDTGEGFIIVADQMADITDFEFFDRETWEHVGVLTIGTVKNTDGIASSQVSYPGYPMGIFAAVDNDSSTVIVGWDVILEAMDLQG